MAYNNSEKFIGGVKMKSYLLLAENSKNDVFFSYDLLEKISNINAEVFLLKHIVDNYKDQTFLLDFANKSKELNMTETTLKSATRKLVKANILIQKIKKMPIYHLNPALFLETRRKDKKDEKEKE